MCEKRERERERERKREREREREREFLRFFWLLMDMCLPKFDIYQGKVAPNCF